MTLDELSDYGATWSDAVFEVALRELEQPAEVDDALDILYQASDQPTEARRERLRLFAVEALCRLELELDDLLSVIDELPPETAAQLAVMWLAEHPDAPFGQRVEIFEAFSPEPSPTYLPDLYRALSNGAAGNPGRAAAEREREQRRAERATAAQDLQDILDTLSQWGKGKRTEEDRPRPHLWERDTGKYDVSPELRNQSTRDAASAAGCHNPEADGDRLWS
jgi:hypothetical protein